MSEARRVRGDFKRVRVDVECPPVGPCALSRWLMRQRGGYVVWDTETTGLEDDAKIVSIGAVDQDGQVLLDTLINPGVPIPPRATAIHGVTDAMVENAPTFAEAYPLIRRALHRRRWVIYNAGYDVPRLEYEIQRNYLPAVSPALIEETTQFYGWWGTRARREVYCAMEMFAEVYGAWSEYHGSYTWQKLGTAAAQYGIEAGNAHNALADAQTTYQVLRHMALDEDGE